MKCGNECIKRFIIVAGKVLNETYGRENWIDTNFEWEKKGAGIQKFPSESEWEGLDWRKMSAGFEREKGKSEWE